MKVIREVTKEEMREKFPDLMSALGSSEAEYCNSCDGLRVHRKLKKGVLECVVCKTQKTSEVSSI